MADNEQIGAYLKRVDSIFSENGDLSKATGGFKPRQSQKEFALAVARALIDKKSIVVEAGTGTGKTFAYLVPALLHGGRVLVSTAGKTLQDQLYMKDIPALIRALGLPLKACILKGRANYICKHRLERAMRENVAKSRDEVRYLHEIHKFSNASRTGERSDVPSVPENSPIWMEVTSTPENCTGGKCEHYEDCFVTQARERAKECDLVIVNHHLFLADLALKDNEMSELLPDFDLIVLDEAHQVPSIAQDFFSDTFSLYDVKGAAQDAIIAGTLKDPKSKEDWGDHGKRIINACDDLRVKFASIGMREEFRSAVDTFNDRHLIAEPLRALKIRLGEMVEIMKNYSSDEDDEDDAEFKLALQRLSDYRIKAEFWENVFSEKAEPRPEDSPAVRWFTLTPKNVWFNETPLSYAKVFRRIREEQGKPWVLTSATLAIRGDFSLFLEQMGLQDAETYRWESPFDYSSQALLYIPGTIGLPNRPEFSLEVVDHIWPLIQKTGGRCFVLCTTLRAVDIISSVIRDRMDEEGSDLELFVQNEAPKNDLINRFRKCGKGILVGSMSFWEGVDIKGDALSMVVIDKVPFTPPDDPVFEGKKKWLESEGRNAFRELALPEATMLLMQGAGRLIRDENDYGVVMICDKRLIDPQCRWGKSVWSALPPFARTMRLEIVEGFLDHINALKR